ncbi:phage holin family protein [Flavobacterium sp. Leaf359]|uniref:phage holin family protein n=1 Tax=Flavobacterium sp. Leaf359 TaxID=1736351 RepID=UPI00138EDD1D|nr:phage holin family protein [Flavobacterium sp. Leaf359]
MREIINMALPKFTLLAMFLKKPLVTTLAVVPTVVVTKLVVDFENVAWVLFWMFLADLGSGLCASYFEWKKSEPEERWFFGKGEGFSSEKFKKMFWKAIVYIGLPYMMIKFQEILMLKNFKYERISEAEFEYATIVLIVFCLNEGFSIFHENLPKCGFNLWSQIKRMIGFYKKVKSEIDE